MPKVFGPPKKLKSQCILEDDLYLQQKRKGVERIPSPLPLPLKAQEPPQGKKNLLNRIPKALGLPELAVISNN